MADEFPPSELTYKSFIYRFKTELSSGKLSYRCKFRTKCSVIMNIQKDSLKKFLSKEIDSLEIIFPGKAKGEHTCKGIKELAQNKESANAGEIMTERETQNLAISIMKNIIEKPFSFHKTALQNANINLKDTWIKNQLQKLREDKFPSNELYLSNIANIIIDLGKREKLKDLNFCQKSTAFPSRNNNKKTELYYIFATEFQINLFDSVDFLFIDATFKTSPKGFYQLLNIIGYLSNTGNSFPLVCIPMTSKPYDIYLDVFNSLKKILEERIKNKELKNIRIVTDFEKSLRKAISTVFPYILLDGCFFHYMKILWSKARDFGLCKKHLIKETFFFIFLFKIYPYVLSNQKKEYLKKVKDIYKENKHKYSAFIEYYEKNWVNPFSLYYNILDIYNLF